MSTFKQAIMDIGPVNLMWAANVGITINAMELAAVEDTHDRLPVHHVVHPGCKILLAGHNPEEHREKRPQSRLLVASPPRP